MIEYVILDNRYNKVIDNKCDAEIIEQAINDKNMKKVQEFKNEFNGKMVYWYQNINTKYMLIYEK